MCKSRLLPFLGCAVVAVLVLLSSSQRLAAQLSPEDLERLQKKNFKEENERLKRMNEEHEKLKRLTEEMERLERERSKHDLVEIFVEHPVEGSLACAGGVSLFAFVILFSLWIRYAQRRGWPARSRVLLGVMVMVVVIGLVVAAVYGQLVPAIGIMVCGAIVWLKVKEELNTPSDG